ncbi:MAG: 3-hydroxybutyryl-CoA dehydrogenase [Syntrophothermus sp.]|uniref:3-hydroxyacyl-CoA dehydrogenase family protein n=1 Tax=Syntrophothermus sp. TaxID=2736299 RepID=UPI00257F4DEC|nr:3-hydroxyacyl-CoA dehydrogenase NAD-binding domain-containing protein [Syntrophothermus sp.]NSW82816.1 3-hydroxybutyryl-CoA dehydrogenase [Syntrophothermus sp.]
METAAVIGAGTMGAGIAQVALTGGYNVILTDVSKDYVDKGTELIAKNLKRMEEKGQIKESAATVMARLKPSLGLEDLAQADIVFEAIIENMDIKKQLFRDLDGICQSNTIFCTNTSGLSITEMASATRRPSQVIGTHFFNPVPVMRLVELIKGFETSDETYNIAKEVCEKFGKTCITVQEAPLFAVNRILVPMIAEAIRVLEEGIATAEDIDQGMKLGANHPIGPLALADMIGLDVLLMVMNTLYNETQDSKYRVPGLLKKLVRAGHYGRKTGRGFFQYK